MLDKANLQLTSTRNRFSPLQTAEVSQNKTIGADAAYSKRRAETDFSISSSSKRSLEENLGPINKIGPKNKTDSSSVTTMSLEENIPGPTNCVDTRNKCKSSKKARNQNPTGDIWEQKSLNLDMLFGQRQNEVLKIGIFNAESVRGKETMIKDNIIENDLDMLLTLESWLSENELPSTREILPSSEMYKLHQLPRPNRKNASGGGMLCIYKGNIVIEKISAMDTKVLEIMDLKMTGKNKTVRLVSIYRPPRSKKRIYPVSDFYDDMENVVSYYKTVNFSTGH